MRTIVFAILMFSSISLLKAQTWETNFPVAKTEAAQSNKAIILVFSGSDWCAPCIKLEKQILESETFKAFANENAILVRADFPRKKENQLPEDIQEQNSQLAELYNQNGYFPFVVVLDAEGHVLGEAGYEKVKPEAYVSKLKHFIN